MKFLNRLRKHIIPQLVTLEPMLLPTLQPVLDPIPPAQVPGREKRKRNPQPLVSKFENDKRSFSQYGNPLLRVQSDWTKCGLDKTGENSVG